MEASYNRVCKEVEGIIMITIETNVDFTPKGKRVAKVVRHAMSGKKIKPVIRMYVAGRAYMDKDLQEFKLVNEWLGGGRSMSLEDKVKVILMPLEQEIDKLREENESLYGTIESMKQTNQALIKKYKNLQNSLTANKAAAKPNYSDVRANNFEFNEDVHNPHRYLEEE